MVMLIVGLNNIRDSHNTSIDKAYMGTDGSAVAETQTALQAGVAASKQDVTTDASSDKTLVVNYTLPSTAATGNTYREFAVIGDGTVEYNRVTFTGVAHTSSDDIVVRTSFFYRNP